MHIKHPNPFFFVVSIVSIGFVFAMVLPKAVHAGIFDSFTRSGIFGDLPNRVRTIFEGRNVDIGGSIVPFAPEPLPSPPPGVPYPDAGHFVKVSVEWDTMWRQEQPSAIDENDPIQELHEEYIKQHGCCATCGEEVIIDARATCDSIGAGCDTASRTNYNNTSIQHVMYGWCGDNATVKDDYLPTPDGSVSSSLIQIESPGPNDNILPNAIPNKMIRRDGYVFECLKVACTQITPTPYPTGVTPPGPTATPIPVPAERYNYIEFQTLVYHSNDFIVELHVDNVGNQPVDYQVYRHAPNDPTTADDDTFWPHNVDVGSGSGISTPWEPVAPPYIHGSSQAARREGNPHDLEGFDQGCAGNDPLREQRCDHNTFFVQYPDQSVRTSIPTGADDLLPGSLTPRDYNFSCDPSDGSESERCGQKILLVPITSDMECHDNRCFDHFRDVSSMGGCGYNASSNNSIIGPIEWEILYGPKGSGDYPSRSVVRASIPVGNPLDDESRPIGWPTTGRISENWGNTGQAQESGESGIRMIDDGHRIEYDEYLFCQDQGSTYPPDGRPRLGDYLHPGIDIKPATTRIRPPMVYTTHAGWVTFAGVDPKYPDKGHTVQIETDVNRDMIPDVLTRYTHLMPGSIQFDVIDRQNPMEANGVPRTFATSHYVPRNTLIGMMGDSGSLGDTHTQYEIVYINSTDPYLPVSDPGNPPEIPPVHGEIGMERCSDDPYIASCIADALIEAHFFSTLRFEPNLIFGPVYVNP